MGVNRYNAMKDLMSIQERVNKLFEDIMDKDDRDVVFHKTWSPLVDIYETDNDFVVLAELPEVNREDVDIRVEDNVLSIRGERKSRKEMKDNNFHRVERKYGYFKRSFRLPSMVVQDDIEANLSDGVLRIVLPKHEESGPKRIEIE